MGFFTVCGNVGGIQQVFTVVAAVLFMQYSDLGFKLEAFNDVFKIKSKDIKLNKSGKLDISFCQKMMILTNCGGPKYLNRFINYGDEKLNKELDLVHLLDLIK